MSITRQKQHDVIRQSAWMASEDCQKEMDMAIIKKFIEDMEEEARKSGRIVIWDVMEVV